MKKTKLYKLKRASTNLLLIFAVAIILAIMGSVYLIASACMDYYDSTAEPLIFVYGYVGLILVVIIIISISVFFAIEDKIEMIKKDTECKSLKKENEELKAQIKASEVPCTDSEAI